MRPSGSSGNEHLEGKLKVIGLGNRGSSAVGRLIEHGKVSGAELWCLDHDPKGLEAVSSAHGGSSNVIVIPKAEPKPGTSSVVSPEDLARIVGPGAYDKDGQGNVNVGDGGVAFLLAATSSLPGGASTLVHLVRSLRAAGHFTAVAVTKPFEFEGQRKLEAAERLVAALEEAAHLVVVVEQDVLCKVAGASAMTVAEATTIADNALEHSVRTVLASLQAAEILKSTDGALIWHGRDLRRYRRLLSPPLQRLLTCPGVAALGRGVASMPASYAHQMGPGHSLMRLASDAVRAAAESPFLADAVGRPSAILCSISLPSPKQRFAGPEGDMIVMHSMRDYDAERAAGRMAVQAAAGALISITGQACNDIVMCAAPREWDDTLQVEDDGRTVQVEASLLVLKLPPGVQIAGQPRASGAGLTGAVQSTEALETAQPQSEVQSHMPGAVGQVAGTAQAQRPRQPQRLSSSNWAAMSAMAGGAKKPLRPPTEEGPPRTGSPGERQKAELPASASMWHASLPEVVTQRSVNAAAQAAATAPVAHQLVDSLQAQSLDLPPQAAKWRQQVRGPPSQQLIVTEASEEDAEPEEREGLPAGLRSLLKGRKPDRVDVRERTTGILLSDRSDSWDQQDL